MRPYDADGVVTELRQKLRCARAASAVGGGAAAAAPWFVDQVEAAEAAKAEEEVEAEVPAVDVRWRSVASGGEPTMPATAEAARQRRLDEIESGEDYGTGTVKLRRAPGKPVVAEGPAAGFKAWVDWMQGLSLK